MIRLLEVRSRRFKNNMPIPGVTTLIRDRFYSVSRTDVPAGPRVVVIAKRTTNDNASNVSDLDVVQATTEADVVTAFGSGSDCHKAFLELVTFGAERIYIVPLPKDTAWNHTTGAVTSVQYGGGSAASVFDAAFAAAESAIPDIVIPWGRGGNSLDWDATPGATPNSDEYAFHADNSSTYTNSWAYKVADKIKEISENTHPCLAVMGIKPYSDGTKEIMTPASVNTHLNLSTLVNKDNASLKDYGPYVVVIASEVKPVGYDYGYSNGACATAACLSKLPGYSSITNKPIYNVQALRYVPTRTQQETLAEKGVNTVVLNYNKVAVFGDGVTFATTGSDYIRLSTKRIVDDAANLIRQVCQKFVGEPSTVQLRNSMDTAISSALRGMQLVGALLASDFNVTYVPADNKAIVDLVLTPAFELKSIQVQIAINI
jgi:hypothetical protein